MRVVFLLISLAIISACSDTATQTSPNGPAFVPVTDAAAFNASLVDQRFEGIEQPEVWFQFNSDGTMVGNLRRGTVTGTWEFEDGYWCREFEAGGTASPYDCQTVELADDLVRFTRNRGQGDAGVYKLN
ncbi:MAG: hypothetical protein AAGI10_02695 [Pseudomonadota bacterium]